MSTFPGVYEALDEAIDSASRRYFPRHKKKEDKKMIIIGEKINGSIPVVADAIARRDTDFIQQRAIAQTRAGATVY